MIIYFGKLNLNSSHIYQVYRKELKLEDILSKLLICLKDGDTYELEEIYKEGVETRVSTTTYKMTLKEKTDEYISGYLYKDAKIYYKKFNENSKEFDLHSVVSNEGIEFYLDVYNEIIGYITANRFGYREFLYAFQGLINESLSDNKYSYKFTVDLLTEGMNIDEIKEELKNIPNIQKLKFKIQPPNIADNLMDDMKNDAEETFKNFEDANVATKSVILTSSSILGLNIESVEVQNQLYQINNIHSRISTTESITNGYVEVEATDKAGIRYTTGEQKAVKKEIDNIIDFKEACREVILKRRLKRSDSNV